MALVAITSVHVDASHLVERGTIYIHIEREWERERVGERKRHIHWQIDMEGTSYRVQSTRTSVHVDASFLVGRDAGGGQVELYIGRVRASERERNTYRQLDRESGSCRIHQRPRRCIPSWWLWFRWRAGRARRWRARAPWRRAPCRSRRSRIRRSKRSTSCRPSPWPQQTAGQEESGRVHPCVCVISISISVYIYIYICIYVHAYIRKRDNMYIYQKMENLYL